MGTPPAPNYANFYFGVHELEVTARFTQPLRFFKRYIDDIFGIWICDDDPTIDNLQWTAFQAAINDYGKLTWEFSDRSLSVNFLDLTINLNPRTLQITTKLYEKPRNLYLYIPPHSSHPTGVLRGLIFGNILRIISLTSYIHDAAKDIVINHDCT